MPKHSASVVRKRNESVGRPRASVMPRRKKAWDGSTWLSDVGASVNSIAAGGSESAELRSPYRQEPWVYACTRRISDAMESAAVHWFAGAGDGAEDADESNPLVQLWNRPNSQDVEADLLGKIGTYLSLTGECFLFLTDEKGNPVAARDDGPTGLINTPSSIWPVIGGRNVQEIVDRESGNLRGWRVQRGIHQVVFPAASVVLIRYPDPERTYRGVGPLGAVFGIAVQNYLAQRYQSSLLANGGEPGGVVSVEGILRPEDYERLNHEIDEAWNNPERAGETRLLEGGAKYTPLGVTPKDMKYAELLLNNRKVMSAVFGVPDAVLGADTSNFATFQGHLRVFWTLTNLPILGKVVRTIRHRLVARLIDPDLRRLVPEADTSRVDALQGDMESASKTAQTFWSIGVPLNNALALAGVSADEYEGGDVGLVNSGLKPLAKLAAEGDPADADRTADPTLALSGIQVQSMLGIVEACAQGRIPKTTAIELIVASFPIDRDRATAIMADIVEGANKPEPDPQTPAKTPKGDNAGDAEDDPEDPADDPADSGKAQRCATPPPVARSEDPAPAGADDTPRAPSPLETREGRVERWKSVQSVIRPTEDWLDRKLRSVFHRMRVRQLAHLAALAKEGTPASKSVTPVYRGAAPSVSAASLTTLRAAAIADRADGSDVLLVVDCTGAPIYREWQPGTAVRSWIRRRPRMAACARRMVDLAFIAKTNLTETEIDALVGILEEKWKAEIESILAGAYQRTMGAADAGIIEELGAAFVATPNPKFIEVLRAKPILVSEGVQSTVAQNLRTALVEVLSESSATGTIQDRILANFADLNKATREQFNMTARRARTIARTEVGQAQSVIRRERMEEASDQGIATTKRWITAVPASAAAPYEDGGYVRFQHWSMDGKTVALKGTWSMPDGTILPSPKSPGGPAHQVINCRCDEVPELDESALV